MRTEGSSPHLHDIEEDLLAQAVLALEELMLWVGAGNVPADQLLARRGHLEQLRVLVLDRHVCGAAQELPHDGPEVVRDALADQLLSAGRGGGGRLLDPVLGQPPHSPPDQPSPAAQSWGSYCAAESTPLNVLSPAGHRTQQGRRQPGT